MQSTVELVMESAEQSKVSIAGAAEKIPICRNSFRWKPFRRYCKLGGDICEGKRKMDYAKA
jgi:hypothetical protein